MWRTPVIVEWMGGKGLKVRAKADTEIVNAHGGLLRLDTFLPVGTPVELHQPKSNEVQIARVVWSVKETGNTARAGVELSAPSQTFWGIYIPF